MDATADRFIYEFAEVNKEAPIRHSWHLLE
jgi:hypothetical protein